MCYGTSVLAVVQITIHIIYFAPTYTYESWVVWIAETNLRFLVYLTRTFSFFFSFFFFFFLIHFLLIFLHSISFNIYIYIFFFLKKKSPLVFGLVCSLRCSSPFSLSTSACYSSVFRVLTMSLVQPIFPIEWIEIKKERKKEKKRK